MTDPECCHCHKKEQETALQKCKTCRNFVCEDHATLRSGAAFCSLGCGEYFFHAEPDDDES